MPTPLEPIWTDAFPLTELGLGASRLFKADGHQVAVFRAGDGQVYAVDNACPHEGYPLVKGTVRDCTLTCIWHNYKFNLQDGRCVMGEEHARSYPVRVRGGQVQVDMAQPDPAEMIPEHYVSLETGLQQRRMGQVTRDCARLLQAGVSPTELLAWVAAYDGRYAEYGTTHVLPVAADLVGYLPRHPGPQATLPIAQVLELAGESHVRRPERTPPDAVDPGQDPEGAGRQLEQLVEDEQAQRAEALVLGALQRGWGRAELEPWLLRLVAAHFLDFGHALIYTSKAFDLLDQGGWGFAPQVLGGLIFRIVNGTREDLLPEWAGWRKRMKALEPELAALHRRQLRGGPGWWERSAWMQQVLDGKPAQAFQATADALREGVPLADLVDGLSLAASERLLRFDVDIDGDRTLQNGWLDVTHIFTFVNALRHTLPRLQEPTVLRLVFQAVHFINHARVLDMPPARRSWGDSSGGGLEALLRHAKAQQSDLALACLEGMAKDTAALAELELTLLELPLQDVATRPIVTAHLIKTAVAALQERRFLSGDPDALQPLRALVRFYASPIDQRFLARQVHDALGFVLHGKVPRSLT